MDDLTAFLIAGLDEDEQFAVNAAGDSEGTYADWSTSATGVVDVVDDLIPTNDSDIAIHIARHDPARVLRDVEAKRRILERYEQVYQNHRAHRDDLALSGAFLALHGVVQALAHVYTGHETSRADHPEYRSE